MRAIRRSQYLHTMTLAQACDVLVRRLRHGRCVFFVGAGISVSPPTCLPAAAGLKSQILAAIPSARHAKRTLEMISPASRQRLMALPLELIIQVLEEWIGVRAVAPLAATASAPPNPNHTCLAEGLALGKTAVVTTNVDTAIEQALMGRKARVAVGEAECRRLLSDLRRDASASAALVKLHGTADNQRSMVATVRRVGRGLGPGSLHYRDKAVQQTY